MEQPNGIGMLIVFHFSRVLGGLPAKQFLNRWPSVFFPVESTNSLIAFAVDEIRDVNANGHRFLSLSQRSRSEFASKGTLVRLLIGFIDIRSTAHSG